MTENQRTLTQNRALHLMFTQLANSLNEHGLDMRRTLKPEIDIPWNATTVKEYLYRPIMKAQTMKESTTELTTKELSQVFETLSKHLSEKFGLVIDWPSLESLLWNQP